MGTVHSFPSAARTDPVEGAWLVYQALAQAAIDDPKLFVDRRHCETMARAWDRWRDLYLETAA